MRVSIVIASLNEGDNLWKTIQSCVETTAGLDCELIVADDASSDGSLREARRRFPQIRVAAHRTRKGCSATKDMGARRARGETLVFLDGHCKPERHALERLVLAVEDLRGEAIVTPVVPCLDCATWKNNLRYMGFGFQMELLDMECGWIDVEDMRRYRRYYESPALVGCCMAMTRKLYVKLWGFDPHMHQWGVEDVDLGLKAWLAGHRILLYPRAVIGHRFRQVFDTFTVESESVLVNRMRMARKCYTDAVWKEWLAHFRAREGEERWRSAWALYRRGTRSLELERKHLQRIRVRDAAAYARRFGLPWPKRRKAGPPRPRAAD